MRGFVVCSLLALAAAACGPRSTAARADATATAAVDWPALDQWTRTSEAPGDVAVIVAIEDYAFLPDVPGARRNASEWEAWFVSRGMKDVFVVTDGNAASEEMLRYADVAAQAATEQSRVWYVFIGHGAPASDGRDGVLVGMDARQTPESLTSRGVRRAELVGRLERGRQAETVVIVDACFSGQAPDGQALAQGTQPVLPVSAAPTLGPRTLLLTAAQGDQFAGALPGADRPAYSYLLLGALRGWGDDGDARLTAGEAHDYVTRQLRHVIGRTQTPGIAGSAQIALTAHAREPDPGITERMRGATSRAVVADETGVQVDTGAGVVVTQLEGWTPSDPIGGLVGFENPGPNEARWHLFGWRDPDGRAQGWVNEFHDAYQKLERQVSPTQLVRYGDVSTFETAYLANAMGHPTTIWVWDIMRPGAFYRVVAISFDSDQYGSANYVEFQRFVRGLRFGSAANAPRLRDGEPGVLGKMSSPAPDETD